MGFLRNLLTAASKNSPMLCTAGAIVTGAATVYFAVRGAEKARQDMQNEVMIRQALIQQQLPEDKKDQPVVVVLTKKEKAKIVLKRIWIAILCGAASTSLMIGGQVAAGRKIRAARAAADIAEKTLQDYMISSVRNLGQKKAAEVVDDAVAERVRKAGGPPVDKDGKVIAYGKGNILCYDYVMDTWFYSTIDKINRAVNECNARILDGEFVLINDFYDEIGDIKHPRDGGILGFGVGLDEIAKRSFIRISYDTGINEDNEIYLQINYTCRYKDTLAPYYRKEVGEVE